MTAELFQRSERQSWPAISSWQAETASLVATALERWHLTAGEPYTGGEAGAVLRVTTAAGESAVLKVGFPHVEAVGEALALQAWSPALAPRVLRQEPWAWWLLLERIEPGIPLSMSALPTDEAIRVGALMLAELSAVRVAPELPSVRGIVDAYLVNAAQRRPARTAALASTESEALVEQGLALAAALAQGDSGRALVHGDLNPGNLLTAGDRAGGWVAIDPKPMRGDPEFDLEPLVTQLGSPSRTVLPEKQLEAWVSLAADHAGLDADLAVRWGVARTALDVTWYAADRNEHAMTAALGRLRSWMAVSGR